MYENLTSWSFVFLCLFVRAENFQNLQDVFNVFSNILMIFALENPKELAAVLNLRPLPLKGLG